MLNKLNHYVFCIMFGYVCVMIYDNNLFDLTTSDRSMKQIDFAFSGVIGERAGEASA